MRHRRRRRQEAGKIPLIIRGLSDGDMLRFIGRENGEDYSTEFLIMLNTWEGAEKFLFSAENKRHQQIEIARFLGRSSRCQQPRGPKSRHRLWPVARRGQPGEPAKGDAGVALDLLAVMRAGNWFKAC
jgi:hypothetical protein